MRHLLFAALVCAAFPAQAQGPSRILPDWMVGAWQSCADGGEVREVWTSGGGALAGINLTRTTGAAQFEFLRIAPGTRGLSFFGSPQGVPPTEFPMITQDAHRVVFENPTHDFPQRVIYARDGRDLTARIEGTMNGHAEHMDWRFKPSTLQAHCPAG